MLGFWMNNVTNFPKVACLMPLPICNFKFPFLVLETLKFKRKG